MKEYTNGLVGLAAGGVAEWGHAAIQSAEVRILLASVLGFLGAIGKDFVIELSKLAIDWVRSKRRKLGDPVPMIGEQDAKGGDHAQAA